MIVTLASRKGGSGKSTIAINLTLVLLGGRLKQNVALIDADEQRSSINILKRYKRENLTIYGATIDKPNRPSDILKTINTKNTHVIFDTAPHSQEMMYECALKSSLVIIPVQPSLLDVDALEKTIKALLTIRTLAEEGQIQKAPECYFIINRAKAGTILAYQIKQQLKKMYPNFPIMKTVLGEREVYKQSLFTGQSVMEYDRKSDAAQEIKNLAKELNGIYHKGK